MSSRDLSDNVISIIGVDAFNGLDALEELLLGDNYLKRLKLASLPPKLARLELQSNLLDLLPDMSTNGVVLQAPYLTTLCVSSAGAGQGVQLLTTDSLGL